MLARVAFSVALTLAPALSAFSGVGDLSFAAVSSRSRTGAVVTVNGTSYMANTEASAIKVYDFAGIADAEHGTDATLDDVLELGTPVTGSGTLPAITSVTTISVSGATVTFNGVSRIFGSAATANKFAYAVSIAAELPSANSSWLEQDGSLWIILQIETW